MGVMRDQTDGLHFILGAKQCFLLNFLWEAVLQFQGVCIVDDNICLVMEYMAGGKLHPPFTRHTDAVSSNV